MFGKREITILYTVKTHFINYELHITSTNIKGKGYHLREVILKTLPLSDTIPTWLCISFDERGHRNKRILQIKLHPVVFNRVSKKNLSSSLKSNISNVLNIYLTKLLQQSSQTPMYKTSLLLTSKTLSERKERLYNSWGPLETPKKS